MKDNLSEIQYSNAIRSIFKEISSQGKNEIVKELPSVYNEEFLAEKILTRILSMKTKTKLQRDRIIQFFIYFDTEVCIKYINERLEEADPSTFHLLLESIPNSELKKGQIKSIIEKEIINHLNRPSLLGAYIRNCDVDESILFNYLANTTVNSTSSLSLAIKHVATNHMKDGARYLPRFLSSRSDDIRYYSFKSIIYLDKVNLFWSELLDYSLIIGSRHFDEYTEAMDGITVSESNRKSFVEKFESILSRQIEKLENYSSKPELGSKKLESLIRRDLIPELSRYKFLENVADGCDSQLRPKFETHEVLSNRIYTKVLPLLAKTRCYYLIEKFIRLFDEDSLIALLDFHSNWRRIDNDILKILLNEEGLIVQLMTTLFSKFKKEKSKERKKIIRNHLLKLTAISEVEMAFDYVEKLLNYESITVDMLVKSDRQVIKDKMREIPNHIQPLHKLNFDETLECLKRYSKNTDFDLVNKYNKITDDVTKYGLLLVLFNQRYINVEKFWDEINKMNPSVVFKTEVNWKEETVKKFRGVNWFSTWDWQTSKLFTPILTKEIVVSAEIYESIIISIKDDDGSYFKFSNFGETEIKSVYEKLVVEKGSKSSKEFGRWFVARNKHGLEILIDKVTKDAYHAAEQFIGLGMDWQIIGALEKFRETSNISIDFKLFNKKMQSRISSKSPGYYTALEWMLAIPQVESFEFIDEMCKEKERIQYFSIGGHYPGGVDIDYRKTIKLVQRYLRDFIRKDYYRMNSQIKEGIEEFIQYFSEYKSEVIGHY